MVIKWLAIPTFVIAAAVPLKDCGTVKVNGPKTKDCPEGVYFVDIDQASQPPVVSYRCEKPASIPSPSAGPASPSPEPVPSASPSTPASPVPSPSATPIPASPSPSPVASPSVSACPRPDDATAAPNRPVPKEPGFRNTFDWSPWFEGKKITAESGCTQYLVETYGEFDAIIIQNGQRSGFEHQGCSLEDVQHGHCDRVRWEDFYLGVDATNSDSGWDHDTYLGAGHRDYCVSYKHLAHYTCTPCTMTTEGKVVDCGARFEIAK